MVADWQYNFAVTLRSCSTLGDVVDQTFLIGGERTVNVSSMCDLFSMYMDKIKGEKNVI